MLTKQPASYRPSSLSTSDTILFVMRDKKGGQGKTQSIGGLSLSLPQQPTRWPFEWVCSLQPRLTKIGAPALLQSRILEWIGLLPDS